MLWWFIGALALGGAILSAPFARPWPAVEQTAPQGWPRATLAFLALNLLLYLNQVAFNVWVQVEHGGDLSFLGDGISRKVFFHLAPDHAPVAFLVARLDEVGWMAPSLLRVQAVLELPWALCAYLLIARLLDPAVARQVAAGPLGWMAAFAHTGVLCVIEILLWNPYTTQDLALRAVGIALTLPLLRWIGREPACSPPPTAVHLAIFFVGLGAASALVLGGNLVFLLYNLATLPPLLPLLGVATALLLACERVRARPLAASDSALVLTLWSVGRRFVLFFAAPALAIRYGISRGEAELPSALAALLVVAAALITGLRDARARLEPSARRSWGVSVALGLALAVPACFVDIADLLDLRAASLPDLWLLPRLAAAGLGFGLGWGLGRALTRG